MPRRILWAIAFCMQIQAEHPTWYQAILAAVLGNANIHFSRRIPSNYYGPPNCSAFPQGSAEEQLQAATIKLASAKKKKDLLATLRQTKDALDTMLHTNSTNRENSAYVAVAALEERLQKPSSTDIKKHAHNIEKVHKILGTLLNVCAKQRPWHMRLRDTMYEWFNVWPATSLKIPQSTPSNGTSTGDSPPNLSDQSSHGSSRASTPTNSTHQTEYTASRASTPTERQSPLIIYSQKKDIPHIVHRTRRDDGYVTAEEDPYYSAEE